MASQAGFLRSCVYTYSKGEIMDTMTKLYIYIDVDHSELIRSFPCNSSDPLTDLSIDTSLCWEGLQTKKTNHGEFGLGNLHIVKSPRLSRYFKLQTLDNYSALEMIRCLEILKLLQRDSSVREPSRGLNLHSIFVNFSGTFFFPSNIVVTSSPMFVSGSPDEDWSIETFEVGAWEGMFFLVPGTYKHCTCIRTEKHQNG